MVIAICHYLIFNYGNSGDYYRIAVESELTAEEVLEYFYGLSNCVIHVKTTDKPHKKERGNRKCDVGIIRACSFYTDAINTFNQKRLKGVDLRHTKGVELSIESNG